MAQLDIDRAICKEYGIKGDLDVDMMEKTSFVKIQMSEIKKAAWRARVDYMISVDMLERVKLTTTDEGVISQYANKCTEHKNLIKQFIGSVKTLVDLLNELDTAK